MKAAHKVGKDKIIVVCLSGRGDKTIIYMITGKLDYAKVGLPT